MNNKINWEKSSVYVAKPAYRAELRHELGEIQVEFNDLLVAEKRSMPVFALDTWFDPSVFLIDSISDAAKKLKAREKFWAPHINLFAGRTRLISENLPRCKALNAMHFPLAQFPCVGEFTLIENNLILCATRRDKSVPDGHFNFIEDKKNPPNRAYLKLWEALSVLGRHPMPGQLALDLGASPGGWTYVLQSFGANVLALDKAPLAENIAALEGVRYQQGSAFSLKPTDFDYVDWLVCDVACYPEKLLRWLMPWIESGKVGQFVVTIKLQGKTDFEMIQEFQKISNSRVLHLYHNKHEVTFLYPYAGSTNS